jgi:hypothetical protein
MAQDDGARREAAASMYKLAVQQFKAGKYQEALEKLLEVQNLDPNPVILYNIGRCFEELGKLADAAEFFQEASANPELPAALLGEIGKRLPKVLPALKVREARTLAVTAVGVGVTQAGDRSLEAYVDSQNKGEIIISSDNSGRGFLWGGSAASVVGLGLVSAAVFIDTGLSDPIEELKDPATRTDRARTLALQDSIASDQTTATILYITGGVVLAAGGAMVALSLMSEDEGAEPQEQGVNLVPFVGEGQAGILIGGSFD